MADYSFLENKITGKWTISAPKRAGRPDSAIGIEPACPFCPSKEIEEPDLYRVPARNASASVAGGGGENGDSNWDIRVVANKFPFAPIHEIVIHSPDHHKNFGELSLFQTELILKAYRNRYKEHENKGQVYIFHNKGEAAGESLPHPHSQIVVVPEKVKLEIPVVDIEEQEKIETGHFYIFCPKVSEWPDEIWLAPKNTGKSFGEITDEETADLSEVLSKLINILKLRHGNEFPYNFYISPEINHINPRDSWPASNASQSDAGWHLTIAPRVKVLGGFEVGTGIFINTQDPKETLAFLKENLK